MYITTMHRRMSIKQHIPRRWCTLDYYNASNIPYVKYMYTRLQRFDWINGNRNWRGRDRKPTHHWCPEDSLLFASVSHKFVVARSSYDVIHRMQNSTRLISNSLITFERNFFNDVRRSATPLSDNKPDSPVKV